MAECGSRISLGIIGTSATDPEDGDGEDEEQFNSKSDGCEAVKSDASNTADCRVEYYLPDTLGGLAELWEQRLAEIRRRRDMRFENESTTAVPSVICTSAQESDHASVTSNDAMSGGLSTRRGNARFGSIRSPFAPSKDSIILRRDQTIHELEDVIYSNIDIIRRIKCAIDEIDTPVEWNGSTSSTDNIALLKDALLCLGSEGGWCKSAEISSLQTKVKVLESTIFMRGIQHEDLQKELRRLNDTINAMQAHTSLQEDEIESLKARVVTLELRSKLQDDSVASLEEALVTQSKCYELTISNLEVECEKKLSEIKSQGATQEDQIKSLRAEIRELQEEKRRAMEEMKKDFELAQLERQHI
ncbi:hypothetical protein ACHAXA_011617 [Cyclostephanos tholiformis]|uniref:Uncharacterized protein n=1 Tax=Cyclostephanos tholiformis TaxID=382380 RepID=A0ABD3RV88_9STRA